MDGISFICSEINALGTSDTYGKMIGLEDLLEMKERQEFLDLIKE